MSKIKPKTRELVSAALFLALGMVLPFMTGQIKEIGDSLLPMHLAVMLCGFVCGYKYGLVVGLILPILRSMAFGMPPLYPNSVWMALELGTYGFVTGFLYNKLNKFGIKGVFISLASAMILGRIVWGIAKTILLALNDKPFLFEMFIAQGFIDAIPGIVLQFILIPIILYLIERGWTR